MSGANRFATNAEIIDVVGDAPEDTALVATGLNFADSRFPETTFRRNVFVAGTGQTACIDFADFPSGDEIAAIIAGNSFDPRAVNRGVGLTVPEQHSVALSTR